MAKIGKEVTRVIDHVEDPFTLEPNELVDPISSVVQKTKYIPVPGLVKSMMYAEAEQKLLPIVARPRGAVGIS